MSLRIPTILYFSSLLPGVAAHPGIVGFVFAVGAPTLVCSVLVVSLFVLVACSSLYISIIVRTNCWLQSPVYIDKTRNPRPPDGQQFPPLLQDNRISEDDGLESRDEDAPSVSTNTSTVPIPRTPQIPLPETLQNNGSLISRSPNFSSSPSAARKIFSNPLAADASSQTSTSDARTITPSKDSEMNKEAADNNNQNSQEENLRAVGGPLRDADNYSPFNGLRRVISDDIEGQSWRHNNDIDSTRSSASNSSNESPATSMRRTTSYSPSLSSTSSVNEEVWRRIQESYEARGSIDSVVGLKGVPVDPNLQSTVEELLVRVAGGMQIAGRH